MVIATRSKTGARGPHPRLPEPDMAAHPSEEELITSFLRPRVAPAGGDDDKPRASFIHDADVYSAGPGELTGGLAPAVSSNGDRTWYFFSAVRTKTPDGQRKARTVDTGEGCWHSEAGAKPVAEGGAVVGHRQSFSFVSKVDGRRVRSGWLMVELSLDDAGAGADMVLCKIYFSPRARVDAGGAASASASGLKRKAVARADVVKNPAASARQRRRGGPPTAEAGTPKPATNAEENDNTGSRGVADESSAADVEPDTSCTDGSSWWSWWMRNRDRILKEHNIVDRTDEEIQKSYGLDVYLRMLDRPHSLPQLVLKP